MRRRFIALAQLPNQARDHAHHVKKTCCRSVMNVRLHHCGIDPQLRAILQAKIDRCLNDQVIDGLEPVWRQPIKVAVERMMLAHAANETL